MGRSLKIAAIVLIFFTSLVLLVYSLTSASLLISESRAVVIISFVLFALASGIWIWHFHMQLQKGVDQIESGLRDFLESQDAEILEDMSSGKLALLAHQIKEVLLHLSSGSKALEDKLNAHNLELAKRNEELSRKQKEIVKQNIELKLAYEDLKESREKYEQLIHNLEDEYYFFSLSITGELIFVSPSIKKILGYNVKEFRKLQAEIITDNPVNLIAKKHRKESLKGQKQAVYEMELRNSDGLPQMFKIWEVPVYNEEGEMVSVEGLAQDITDRILAEQLIKENEEKYRMVFDYASDFMFLYAVYDDGSPGNFIEVNDYALSRLKYTIEEIRNITPNDLTAVELWNDRTLTRANVGTYERIWEAKDGDTYNVEISEHHFMIKKQKVCIAVARDITERKKVENEIRFMNEELINQKENLEALLDNLTQTQEQLVQSEKMAALGQLIAGVAHEINTPLGAIKASIGNLTDSLDNAFSELPALFKTQKEENLLLFLEVFELARGIRTDLSSREKRQKKREIRKGLSAQGIENPDMLADLLVYLGVYENYEKLYVLLHQEDALKVLRTIRNFISLMNNSNTISIAAEKAAKVVFALKKYAHRDALGEKVPTDLVDGIETVLTLYESQIKQGITVEKKFGDLPMVMSYQDEINQVWTNLIQNSIQAMNQHGTLTLEAEADERQVTVKISDTGEGIEPGIQEKIFEPFYTTKKQGEGSGLGLDIVKKIIDKHDGSISLESVLGEGTSFTIRIPIY